MGSYNILCLAIAQLVASPRRTSTCLLLACHRYPSRPLPLRPQSLAVRDCTLRKPPTYHSSYNDAQRNSRTSRSGATLYPSIHSLERPKQSVPLESGINSLSLYDIDQRTQNINSRTSAAARSVMLSETVAAWTDYREYSMIFPVWCSRADIISVND